MRPTCKAESNWYFWLEDCKPYVSKEWKRWVKRMIAKSRRRESKKVKEYELQIKV